ncbi:MAG: capsule biosynthesis protein [Paracoccus sp. (in: a-proteobacteria)]|nr:capsule biosynthesis protein [Paracoccus sp. (in: a-proteobacteria)]
MTTPPKVRIYHAKRSGPAGQQPGAEAVRAVEAAAQAATADLAGTPADPAAGIATQGALPDTPAAPEAGETLEVLIAAVRAEGLTGRQLRLARRIAAMHGIEVASEEEAVIVLRQHGVDPFHRSSLSQVLAAAGSGAAAAAGGRAQQPASPSGDGQSPNQVVLLEPARLPQAGGGRALGRITPAQHSTERPALPSREEMTEDKRAAEIYRIQRDIARRRRWKQFWLTVRLILLVGIPTVIAGWYYFSVATPLYETRSQFMIQQADTATTATGSSILSGIQLNPDSVAVQSYLTSQNALLRLDQDLGFKQAFQDPALDPLLRLPANATDDDAFKTYTNMVKVGYDPTEGVLNMTVVAPDPALSERFAVALISYAEGMVDDMTGRVRADQMEGARQNYADAENRVREAQNAVQALQEQMGVLDAASESSLIMARIGQLQGDLTTKQLELAQLMANPQPNPSRVQGVEGDISRLRELIAETRAELTQGNEARGSLAQIAGRLRIAEADLATRQTLLASAAEQLELARIEANKQVRYLSLSVAPVVPQSAAYPKALSNTLVAFLIFMAIYLMLSLTASILREQVST